MGLGLQEISEMDMQTFIVQAISVNELTDVETFLVGMYDNAEMPGEYFEIQKSLTFDEQDYELGMNTYCIVLSNGATHYGGIESCVLQGNLLNIGLLVTAAQTLGIHTEIECHLQVTQDAIDTLRSGLQRIFENDIGQPQTLAL